MPSSQEPSTDALSRLPLKYKADASVEEEIFFHPVSATEIEDKEGTPYQPNLYL